MNHQYSDPVLQVIGDLRLIFNQSVLEIEKQKDIIKEQNSTIGMLKTAIENANNKISSLESRVMSLTEQLLKDTEVA